MHGTTLPRWIPRAAWFLACAWPLSLHATILAGRPEWAPSLTALAAAFALALWALAIRRIYAAFVAAAIALVLGTLTVTAPEALLYAPPVLINAALAFVFGVSLRAERVPVVTVFARLEQGVLPPDLAFYTRCLTWTWTVYFAAMATISMGLAAFGPLEAWSTFSNLVSYVLIGILFVGEHAYRRRRFHEYRHAPLFELLRNVRRAGVLTLQRPAP